MNEVEYNDLYTFLIKSANKYYSNIKEYVDFDSIANITIAKAFKTFDSSKNDSIKGYSFIILRNEIFLEYRQVKNLNCVYLDTSVRSDYSDSDNTTYKDLLHIDVLDNNYHLKLTIDEYSEKLSNIERIILDDYFNEVSQIDTGINLNMTSANVSRIRKKIFTKLKKEIGVVR